LDEHIEKPSKWITEFATSGKALPIGIAYSAINMDSITEYATGSVYGDLDYGDFKGSFGLLLCGIRTNMAPGIVHHLAFTVLHEFSELVDGNTRTKAASI